MVIQLLVLALAQVFPQQHNINTLPSLILCTKVSLLESHSGSPAVKGHEHHCCVAAVTQDT